MFLLVYYRPSNCSFRLTFTAEVKVKLVEQNSIKFTDD